MYESTVSIQGQTTIPVQIRNQLGLVTGARMIWETIQDKLGVTYVRITPGSAVAIKSLRGIGRNVYKKYGTGRNYLLQEKASWDKKST